MFSFLDRFETWLFNIFRRLLILAALLTLVAVIATLAYSVLTAIDTPDVRANDSIAAVKFSKFAPDDIPDPVAKADTASTVEDQGSEEITDEAPIKIDVRVTAIAKNYASLEVSVNEELFVQMMDRDIPHQRHNEFLDGLVNWSENVMEFYGGSTDKGSLYPEISETIDTYTTEFLFRVQQKFYEAEASEEAALANQLGTAGQLMFVLYGLGVIVTIIIFLLAFKVEVDLRAIKEGNEQGT